MTWLLTTEYGYGPIGSRPTIVGFQTLGDATAKAEKWMAKGVKWSKSEGRYVPREDGRHTLCLFSKGERSRHWQKRGQVVGIKSGESVTVSTWL